MFVQYRINRRNKQLLKTLPFPDTGNFLDVSHGDGSFLNALHTLHPNLKLFGIDLSLPENSNPKINFQIASATDIPFEDETFDFISCAMSLHHYENLEKSFQEMSRVLRTNGTLYITDIMPGNKFFQKLYNFMGCSSPYHFEKYYTEQDLISLGKKFSLQLKHTYKIALLPRIRTLHFTK